VAKLILVRHGITRLYHEQRFWGKTDVELSEAGIKQSEQLRDRLAKERVNVVYSSTLKRARTTAEIIAIKHGLTVQPCRELDECNFGYAEGLTFAEIQNLHPELAKALNGFDTPIQFPGGESFGNFEKRVKGFLNRLANHEDKDTIVIVAHGGSLQLIICHLLGIGVKHWRKMRLGLASISVLDTYPKGVILSSLNDVSHLK
jgi:broad specificity phosphatase PhoE